MQDRREGKGGSEEGRRLHPKRGQRRTPMLPSPDMLGQPHGDDSGAEIVSDAIATGAVRPRRCRRR